MVQTGEFTLEVEPCISQIHTPRPTHARTVSIISLHKSMIWLRHIAQLSTTISVKHTMQVTSRIISTTAYPKPTERLHSTKYV